MIRHRRGERLYEWKRMVSVESKTDSDVYYHINSNDNDSGSAVSGKYCTFGIGCRDCSKYNTRRESGDICGSIFYNSNSICQSDSNPGSIVHSRNGRAGRGVFPGSRLADPGRRISEWNPDRQDDIGSADCQSDGSGDPDDCCDCHVCDTFHIGI